MKSNNNEIILRILEENYKGSGPELLHENPFELLIATILSAQCTDVQVNKITPGLFRKFPRPEDLAAANIEDLEEEIRSCGFYRTKSKNIKTTSQILLDKYDGRVPEDLEELQLLPGVGRKTANVVVSNAFGIPAIAVDTHVFRVSNRLGLAKAKNVLDTEKQLMDNIPQEKWTEAHHWLIQHGRRLCNARNPKCNICFLSDYCPYYKNNL